MQCREAGLKALRYLAVRRQADGETELEICDWWLRDGDDLWLVVTGGGDLWLVVTGGGDLWLVVTGRWWSVVGGYGAVVVCGWWLRDGGDLRLVVTGRWRSAVGGYGTVAICGWWLRGGGDLWLVVTDGGDLWLVVTGGGDLWLVVTGGGGLWLVVTGRWRSAVGGYGTVAICGWWLRDGGDLRLVVTGRWRSAVGGYGRWRSVIGGYGRWRSAVGGYGGGDLWLVVTGGGDLRLVVTGRWRSAVGGYGTVAICGWWLRDGGDLRLVVTGRWRSAVGGYGTVAICGWWLRDGGDLRLVVVGRWRSVIGGIYMVSGQDERRCGPQRGEPQHSGHEQSGDLADVRAGRRNASRRALEHSVLQRSSRLDSHQRHSQLGTPFETPDQGKARLLTHWEQLDYGVQFTSSRKFFTISPIILYFLTSFYTKYDTAHFVINTASLLSVLIPKLPQLHGVRLFGINKY
ncbi:hypothetical protein HF521_016006 [Silurus meridionalis]|uniref:ORM1-like protein 3 n=1 Tax=Silurus meridionalis TaxID=175797 RepID=A0A8T0BUM1_SILME|nr:hypothetical protein HF521_016006 [Silurus meridionalis]